VSTTMRQIETIVMLMLENRSLDTMLGWLFEDSKPVHVYPRDSDPLFQGIPTDAGNRRRERTYHPTHGSPIPSQRSRLPRWGPKEDMEHVQIQMYADGDGIIHDRNWGPPPMTGFAWDYPVEIPDHVGDVMGGYTADDLPVHYRLARNYAVSDRWFSSVPSETDPNRAVSAASGALQRISTVSTRSGKPFKCNGPYEANPCLLRRPTINRTTSDARI
jgi:phospholipase C